MKYLHEWIANCQIFLDKRFFTGLKADRIIRPRFAGGIAQLGERLHGMQEVSGSIPLTSTNVF